MSRILVIAAAFALFGAFLVAAVIATEASPAAAGTPIEIAGAQF